MHAKAQSMNSSSELPQRDTAMWLRPCRLGKSDRKRDSKGRWVFFHLRQGGMVKRLHSILSAQGARRRVFGQHGWGLWDWNGGKWALEVRKEIRTAPGCGESQAWWLLDPKMPSEVSSEWKMTVVRHRLAGSHCFG